MFSKKKALLIFVILLSLCLCISGISAEEAITDVDSGNLNSASEDSVQAAVDDTQDLQESGDDTVVAEEEPSVGEGVGDDNEYNVTSENFFNYFENDGRLKDETVLPNGSTLNFIGTFENLPSVSSISLNRPINIMGVEGGKIKDISFIISSSGVSLCGLNLDYTGPENVDNILIYADHADDLYLSGNTIKFVGQGGATDNNFAIYVAASRDVSIQTNYMDVTVPSAVKDWDSVKSTQIVRDGAIYAELCDNILINFNELNLTNSTEYSEYGTIQVITVQESENALVTNNKIRAKGKSYIYGIFIFGVKNDEIDHPADGYVVANNNLNITGEFYANGIDIDNYASGIIDENSIYVRATNVTYAIYTNTYRNGPPYPSVDENPSYNNITNNNVYASSNSVYCIELMATGENVIGNKLIGVGSFVIGIGSAADPEFLEITNNYIYCNGDGEGTPTGGDLSVASSNTAIVTTKYPLFIRQNYIYTKSGDFAIDLESTEGSIITYNTIIAKNKAGVAAINSTGHDTISNNNEFDAIEINAENIFKYINNETGYFFNFIPDGATITFVGNFADFDFETITINKKVNVIGSNAVFKDIGINVIASDVNITSITIDIDYLYYQAVTALYVNASDVSVTNSEIIYVSPDDIPAYAVYGDAADRFTFTNNKVYFVGNGNYEGINYGVLLARLSNAVVEENNFTFVLPSADISYVPPTYAATLLDGGIVVQNSNGVTVSKNNINLTASDSYTYSGYDTIYVIDVESTNGFTFTDNNVTGVGKSYIYGLVLSGNNFDIENNVFNITGGNYSNGMNFAGSTGDVIGNTLFVVANDVTYGFYSYDWTGTPIQITYQNNKVYSKANSVYGMELIGNVETVDGNNFILEGNFTTGIGAYGIHDYLIITNNNVTSFAEGLGTPNTVDSFIPSTNVGVIIINSPAQISLNTLINNAGKYAVNLSSSTGVFVTGNSLFAKDYVGGAAVYADDLSANTVSGNTPLMDAVLYITASNETLPGENLIITVNGTARDALIENGQITITVKSGVKTLFAATVTVLDGKAIAAIPSIQVGEYTITATYDNPDYNPATAETLVNITDHITLAVNNLNSNYKYGQYLVATLYKNNVAYAAQEVIFNVSGKIIKATTASNGQAKFLATDLDPATYKVAVSSNGVSKTVTVKIAKSAVKFTSVTKSVKKGKYFQLKVLTAKNKVIAKQVVIIKIGNKKFNVKTNAKGIAKVKVNLAPKKYKVTYQLKNNKYYASTSKSSTLTVKK